MGTNHAQVPLPACAALAAGLDTALVVDVGHEDVRVMPVVCGLPVVTAWRTVAHGGKAAARRLRELILDQAQAQAARDTDTEGLEAALTPAVVQTILHKAAVVRGAGARDTAPVRYVKCMLGTMR
jgi:actin-related protein